MSSWTKNHYLRISFLSVSGVGPHSCQVPVLVVPGQHADALHFSQSATQLSPDGEHFLDVMSNLTRWRHDEIPSKIGTVKLHHAVTLAARQEHLVWGRLPSNTPLSLGSTILIEPTSSHAKKHHGSLCDNIYVG